MPLLRRLVGLIAARLRVPPEALEMLHAANQLSGLSTRTLPAELIPLNATQFSRGLLNYTVMQTLEGWLFPFWAERQYDINDPAFIPRSHLGLSMNLTHRNWTAAGSPESETEPIVDPRGLVTPFRNGWSIDVWVWDGENAWFPSRFRSIRQELVDGLPVVQTTADAGPLRFSTTVGTEGAECAIVMSVENRSRMPVDAKVALAIRPFNPEGVGLIHSLAFDGPRHRFIVNGREAVAFDPPPHVVSVSSLAGGDTARRFPAADLESTIDNVKCPSGLANGFAEYRFSLPPAGSRRVAAACNLVRPLESAPFKDPIGGALRNWRELLGQGASIETPDPEINAALRSSIGALLMFCDGDSITPGPFTYHHFWFRDAAIMLYALDAVGFHAVTRRIIACYPDSQQRDGFFRSQQGEWDSNGQVLWSCWKHSLLSGDASLFKRDLQALRKGVEWIDASLIKEPGSPAGRPGILPAGLSAEHLGLSDQYYWDDFWSLAGIRSFLRGCSAIGNGALTADAERTMLRLQAGVDLGLASDASRIGSHALPAAPGREFDSGMIGSIVAGYPLQIFPPESPVLARSLRTMIARFFLDGLFHQKFVHSGGNPYLTLQVAQNALYAGDRTEFLQIFRRVLRAQTPTGTYPEAIHPATGGGCMGDGHHGWAAAEIVLAIRNMFAWEAERDASDVVHLLSGIPLEWMSGGEKWNVERLPLPGGLLTMRFLPSESGPTLRIDWERRGSIPPPRFFLHIPLGEVALILNGKKVNPISGGIESQLWIDDSPLACADWGQS